MADTFAFLIVTFAVLGAKWGFFYCMLSGAVLHMLVVTSHNFFHMKDNWRMYYFNLSLMSYRFIKMISINLVLTKYFQRLESQPRFESSCVPEHCLGFGNQHVGAPLPIHAKPVKDFAYPFLALGYQSHFIRYYVSFPIRKAVSKNIKKSCTFFIVYFRVYDVVMSRKLTFRMEELFCLTLPLSIFLLSGTGLWSSFVAWNYVILTASFIFGVVGLTAAHHHPEIFHEGDAALYAELDQIKPLNSIFEFQGR